MRHASADSSDSLGEEIRMATGQHQQLVNQLDVQQSGWNLNVAKGLGPSF